MKYEYKVSVTNTRTSRRLLFVPGLDNIREGQQIGSLAIGLFYS